MTHSTPRDSSSGALERLGFNPRLALDFECWASPGAQPFRVIRVDAQGCSLLGATGEQRGRVPKRIRDKSPPVVGDWVIARERQGELVLRRILERTSTLTRRAAGSEGRAQVLAANLDRVVICSALDQEFRLARLERWLSLVYEGESVPLVVLTKAGLVDANLRDKRQTEASALAPGLEVLVLDVFAGIGLDTLDHALRSDERWAPTLALVGSSGVGKSTLVNYLCGRHEGATARTQGISQAHGKGRHTTSHRELFELPERNLLLIDTPGLREVGMWGQGQGLDATFAELSELAAACRFADCGHANEPGCAITAALASGQLDQRRFESWQRLVVEQAATARRASEHERRDHERRFAKLYRETIKAKKRRR